jgi:hypothetical protein
VFRMGLIAEDQFRAEVQTLEERCSFCGDTDVQWVPGDAGTTSRCWVMSSVARVTAAPSTDSSTPPCGGIAARRVG